jgi:hypothetical protein
LHGRQPGQTVEDARYERGFSDERLSEQVLGGTIVAGLAALSLTATTATAGITGPCTATIAGVNVANQGTGPTAKPIVVSRSSRSSGSCSEGCSEEWPGPQGAEKATNQSLLDTNSCLPIRF